MATNLFLMRTFDQPLSVADVCERVRTSDWCYAMHKVDWRGSFLATNGQTMICWFTAADAESVRIALRQSGADTQCLWQGTVHEAPEPPVPNVIVERSFEQPVTFAEISAAATAGAGCFQMHRVRYARTFFSLDRRRMMCLYDAPDAESVRIAQREAALPHDTVWAFQSITPETERSAST
jgi:hypothetical protein